METGHLIFVAALMVSSLLNVAYLLPVVVRGFFPGGATEFDGGIKEAPLACLIPLSFTAVMCVILFFFPDPVYDLLAQLVP
jgi:multicomponent Na+:H+ antiporter subunit D